MANIANVKVRPGNVLSLSGSSVEITGSSTISGNLNVLGTITADNLIVDTVTTASTVFTSGSTQFGDDLTDSHTFSGSVNIFGLVSSSMGFSGSGAGLTNVIKSVTAGTNLTASTVDGAVTVSLTGSITGGLDTLTGLTTLSSSGVTGSAAEFVNLLLHGSASLTENAYIRYVASPVDKIEIFPGLLVSGSTVISGNLDVTGSVSASVFSGSGAGLVNVPASQLSGVVPLAKGGTGKSISGDINGQLLIGSGSELVVGDLLGGLNVGITKDSGSITIAVTGNLGVSEVTGGANISASISGNSLTVALSQSVTGLTSLTTDALVVNNSSTLNGKLMVSLVTTSTSYTLDSGATPDSVVSADATGGALTVTLPSADPSGLSKGRLLVVKKSDSSENTVTVSGSIDGESFFQLNGPQQSITLVATDTGGTSWIVV